MMDRPIPNGDCFEAAFNYIANDSGKNHGLLLVHGKLSLPTLPQGEKVNHAWIEDDARDTVWEVSSGMNSEVPRNAYYAKYAVSNTRKYNVFTALEMAADAHYGPWH